MRGDEGDGGRDEDREGARTEPGRRAALEILAVMGSVFILFERGDEVRLLAFALGVAGEGLLHPRAELGRRCGASTGLYTQVAITRGHCGGFVQGALSTIGGGNEAQGHGREEEGAECGHLVDQTC